MVGSVGAAAKAKENTGAGAWEVQTGEGPTVVEVMVVVVREQAPVGTVKRAAGLGEAMLAGQRDAAAMGAERE